ncbi:glycosyltransferase [Desertibaculum subflavum]|uniref:glycosyltransferase n=1 Tax=Desertibaculum subflavum TaxID=2268458 RepID=UPI000E67124C
MRASSVFAMILVVAANVAAWVGLNPPRQAPAYDKPFSGLSYSPYREGQDPQKGDRVSAIQIAEDMAFLADKTQRIRTYTATDGHEAIPYYAGQYGLKVTAGAWIDSHMDRNEREIANVAAMARSSKAVTRILVGNEVLLRDDISVNQLLSYIRRVRTQVSVPISTAEPWHVWIAHPELAAEVDFIAIHTLPYWEGLPSDKAVAYAMDRYQQVKNAFPTKPVVITEFGWPSEGRMRRGADPSVGAQGQVIRTFLNEADKRGIDFFIMEAFDQPWKRNIEGSVGGYWGVFTADRQAKFPLTGSFSSVPQAPWFALGASLLAAPLMLWFLRRWSSLTFAGRATFLLAIQAVASVLVWTAYVGLHQYFSPGMAVMWAVLLPLLVVLLALLLTEGIEATEVLFGTQLRRRFLPYASPTSKPLPKVSLHLPICNEPPEMVKLTLNSLAALDYPDFEVLVIDNNTKDPKVWQPVREHCEKLGPRFRFFHEDTLKGFKAGALNYALARTAPDAEVIGVIDSDYMVAPNWLKSLVPYFERPEVGFVQAPQDHRDAPDSAFKEMINWEYAGFFDIGMVQRNEADAIIQHGTMTLIRKAALSQVGDWSEWCICEDAELGMKLMEAGWQSVYCRQRFGWGLTPDSFTGYKKQRFRWAYGAVQILKGHWRALLPWDKRLTWSQKYHFVAGWAPWFADALGLVFAYASIIWTIGVLALPRYFEFPHTLFIVPTLAVFLVKVVQFLGLYRARVDCGLRQRIGAGIAGLALTYSVAKAMLYGIFTSKLPFMRTPKCENQPAMVQAIAMAWEEASLAALLWLSGAAIWFVYGYDDPEARLWSLVMWAQSLPCVAAVITATLNAFAGVTLFKPAKVTAPAATTAATMPAGAD